MFARIVILAFAIQGSIAAPSYGDPVLDALNAHHNIVIDDQSYTSGLKQVLNGNVVIRNNPIQFQTGIVGTPSQPVSTGEIMGEHVETFAIGQQQKVLAPHTVIKEPRIATQTIQVPVQTLQTVQVPSVQYQNVQVPVQVQKEIVQVEKPVPVPQPVPVESPPKPYVKEAIYARPFQRSQKITKTRITPLEEVKEDKQILTTTTEHPPTSTTTQRPKPQQQQFVDYTEENLYYANRKRKVITRFIKIEEYYEADTTEEVGVFYSYGPSNGDNFELKVTRIFEVDQPILVKNVTTTTKVANRHSSAHVIYEYLNNKLLSSFDAGTSHTLLLTPNVSDSHIIGSQTGLIGGAIIPGKSSDQFSFKKYTDYVNGKMVEIEERTYVLPGGHALFVEKRIHAVGDYSPFHENIEPVPSFASTTKNGEKLLILTLTYDSTTKVSHEKYGILTSESFGKDFSSFLREFKQYIPSNSLVYNRLKRSIDNIDQKPVESSRKKRSVEPVTSPEAEEIYRKKREPKHSLEFHGKIYSIKEKLNTKDYHPGGYIYKSADGSEIKVEEETIAHIEGAPKNEYLRFSQVYVPKEKVKFEVSGLFGQPIESYLHGFGYGGLQSYPFNKNIPLFNNGFSYKYGSPQINHPFYQL